MTRLLRRIRCWLSPRGHEWSCWWTLDNVEIPQGVCMRCGCEPRLTPWQQAMVDHVMEKST